LFGGAGTVGKVTLSAPAPDGGLQVALSSAHAAVTVPPTVVVPAGALSAEFVVATQAVAEDVTASVEASASGRSISGSLAVWTVLPQFFSWTSEPTWFFGGVVGRRTAQNSRITASCSESAVSVSADAGFDFWSAYFSVTRGQAVRAGVYEVTDIPGAIGPTAYISVGGGNFSCSPLSGRFVVHDVEVQDGGRVNRFWASFEYRCGGAPYMHGDVRVTNPPPPTSPFRPMCYH